MKNDRFHKSDSQIPVEFEMSDYDKAKRDSPFLSEQDFSDEETVPPGMVAARPHLEQKSNQEPPLEDPEIKQEPSSEIKIEPAESTSPKVSREVKKLKGNLNGTYWGCKGNHGRRRLDVTKTVVDQDLEFKRTWDNVINLDEVTHQED